MVTTRESGGTAVTGSGHTSDIDRFRIEESLPDGQIATILGISRRQVNRLAGTRSDSARRYAARAAEAATAPPAPVQRIPQVPAPDTPVDTPEPPPVVHDVRLGIPGVWATLAQHGWSGTPENATDYVLATFVPVERMPAWFDCTTLEGVLTRVPVPGSSALNRKYTDEKVRHSYERGSGSMRGARNGAINRAKFLAYDYGLVLEYDENQLLHPRGAGVRGIYVIGYIDAYFHWHVGQGPRTPHDLQRTFDECYADHSDRYPATFHYEDAA